MAKAEPKLGRPRKPPGEKKSGRIEIRVTEAEHAAMEAAAARAERSGGIGRTGARSRASSRICCSAVSALTALVSRAGLEGPGSLDGPSPSAHRG